MSHDVEPPSARTQSYLDEIVAIACKYPESHEDHPWGDTVVKVKGKVFVFAGASAEGYGISVKLPQSGAAVLEEPWAEPTGYGLGKSGWVSIWFEPDTEPPLDRVRAWLDESYRAVAPKRLVKSLG